MTCADSCACERFSAQNRPIRAGESIPAHRLDDQSPDRSILAEAESLVYGDRGADYGPPWIDHQIAADIVNAWAGLDLTATDVQHVLVAVKLARMRQTPTKRDHYVDAAGYLDCLWRTIERTPGAHTRDDPGSRSNEHPRVDLSYCDDLRRPAKPTLPQRTPDEEPVER